MLIYEEAFDIHNRRNDWKSATTDSMWSKNDHCRVGTRSWHLSRIHSCDSLNDLKMRRVSAKFVRGRWPRITCCAAIPRWEKHSCHHSITLLSGSRSECLLAVPYSENGSQGDAFRNHGGHQIKCDGRTPEDSKRSLPPVLPTMAGTMEQVCVCARVLLWRWLGKRCHMSYHFSAIPPHFRELFDCPI